MLNTLTYKHTCTNTHTYEHTHIRTHAHTNTHIRTYMYTYKHTHVQAQTRTNIHTYKHTHVQTHTCTNTHTYEHTHRVRTIHYFNNVSSRNGILFQKDIVKMIYEHIRLTWFMSRATARLFLFCTVC